MIIPITVAQKTVTPQKIAIHQKKPLEKHPHHQALQQAQKLAVSKKHHQTQKLPLQSQLQ